MYHVPSGFEETKPSQSMINQKIHIIWSWLWNWCSPVFLGIYIILSYYWYIRLFFWFSFCFNHILPYFKSLSYFKNIYICYSKLRKSSMFDISNIISVSSIHWYFSTSLKKFYSYKQTKWMIKTLTDVYLASHYSPEIKSSEI